MQTLCWDVYLYSTTYMTKQVYINSLTIVITGILTGFYMRRRYLSMQCPFCMKYNSHINYGIWINDLLLIICIILLYRMVLCSLYSVILLLFLNKDSINNTLCPVSSAHCICRIAAMTKPCIAYYVLSI